MLIFILSFISAVQFASATQINAAPTLGNIALVYDGPGACVEDCAAGAAHTAQLAGLIPKIIGPNALTEASTAADIAALFRGAVVWIQPGGKSRTAMTTMTPRLIEAVQNFVRKGGGYVGFCAGAFSSTDIVGTTTTSGFGFIDGRTKLFDDAVGNPGIETINWNGKTRKIYWEGGPFHRAFAVVKKGKKSSRLEVMARYSDGSAASVRQNVGCGRAYVTGLHPEAPRWWKTSSQLTDTDGDDFDLAVEMIHWSMGDSGRDPARGCQ